VIGAAADRLAAGLLIRPWWGWMSEQRRPQNCRAGEYSSTLLSLVDGAALLTGQFLEVTTGIATHPTATGRRGIDNLTEQFRLMPNITSPMVTTCMLQPCRVVTAQGSLHVFHTDSPDYGRHPGWARPVV